MSDLFAARSQMAISLAFHIVFAAIGIGMPLLMVLSEAVWLRTRDAVWLEITKAWARGVAVFFAVGAVSGTVLSFELGLLWPTFMEHAGPIFGMPFSWEGAAFFLEAIALALTKRLNGRAVETELTASLFNKATVDEYVAAVQAGANPLLPRMLIEVFLSDDETVRALRGSNNHEKADAIGVRLEIAFNDEFKPEYAAFLQDRSEVRTIPIEFYSVQWCSFAGSPISEAKTCRDWAA